MDETEVRRITKEIVEDYMRHHEQICAIRYDGILVGQARLEKTIETLGKDVKGLSSTATTGGAALKTLLVLGGMAGALIGIAVSIIGILR